MTIDYHAEVRCRVDIEDLERMEAVVSAVPGVNWTSVDGVTTATATRPAESQEEARRMLIAELQSTGVEVIEG